MANVTDAVYRIRPATRDDLEGVVALFLQLRDHHRPLQPDNPRYHVSDERWRELAAAALADGRRVVLVAEDDDGIAGFANASYVDKPQGLACHIDTLVVGERARNQGIGNALVDAVEERARQDGSIALRVDVLPENPDGRRFYERRGYRLMAVRYGREVPGNSETSS